MSDLDKLREQLEALECTAFDREAAIELLRRRYPTGPLIAHVAGLLARDGAAQANRDAAWPHLVRAAAIVAASVELREAERHLEAQRWTRLKDTHAERLCEEARARWRAALDPPDAGRTAESGGGEAGADADKGEGR